MAINSSLLIAAVAFVGVVGVIAVDGAFGVDPRLEWQDTDGTWHEVATASSRGYYGPGVPGFRPVAVPENGSVDFRLTVANDRPIPLERDVTVVFNSHFGHGTRLVAESRLDLGAFESEVITFTLRADQVFATGVPERPVGGANAGGQMTVTVGATTRHVHLDFQEVNPS